VPALPPQSILLAQTGLPCSACHIGFPQLTPFGRRFKLEGYTAAPISGDVNGKPNTQSFTTELDYYLFNNGGPGFLRVANAKLFVEETIYTQFNGLARDYDGNGRNAQGNDVLFTGVWVAF
jgi:hypothetical protein